MNKIYLIGAGLFILGLLIGIFSGKANFGFTGSSIADLPGEQTLTKAICNGEKCIDVSIECKNGEIASMKPVSDLKNFSDLENWTNPGDERFKGICK